MKCKVCGNELSENALFCGNCGAKAEPAGQPADEAGEEAAAAPSVFEGAKIELTTEPVFVQTEQKEEAAKPEQPEHSQPVVQPAYIQQPMPPEFARPVVDAAPNVGQQIVNHAAAQEAADKQSAKAARKKYMVKKNPAASTVFCVLLSILLTASMFWTTTIIILGREQFDDFYYNLFNAGYDNAIDFWTLTSYWFLIAAATITGLLVLMFFFAIRRRKYAVLNYVGIPLLINGAVFTLFSFIYEWVAETFDFSALVTDLFYEINDTAKSFIMLVGLILLGAGVLFILVYALVSVIHKTVYRKKCIKAENGSL